ncbi:MAG: hypothetical protein AAGG46_11020 [Planctomycetota bacterium]
MEPDNLRDLVQACPFRLTMINGETFDIEQPEFIMVAEFDVAVLVNRDGVKRNVLLALDNIASAESIAKSAS